LPSQVPRRDEACAHAGSASGTLTFTFADGSQIFYGVCDALQPTLQNLWRQGNEIAAHTGPQCAQVFRDGTAYYDAPVYVSGCYNDDSLVKDTGIKCQDGRTLVTHASPNAWAFVDSFVHLTPTAAVDDAGYEKALKTCTGS